MEKISIKKDNCNEVEHFVKLNLHKYNQKNCDYIKHHSSYDHNNTINGDFMIYDHDKIIGGALGYIRFEWYHFTDFYIDEEYRGQGIGSEMIKRIEEFAKENHAIGVRVASWDFHAPKFYQKLGYTVWGKFEDCPPGTIHYYLYKRF